MSRLFLFFVFLGLWVPFGAGAKEVNLVRNPGFESGESAPDGYELQGAAAWGRVGGGDEMASRGILFPGTASGGGAVAQKVVGLDPAKGRWVTFRFRGRAEDGFAIADDSLKIKIEFYAKGGSNYLDCASRPIYAEIERDRRDFTANGNHHRNGASVWRTYELEELLPFPEVDAVRVSVVYAAGASTSSDHATFMIDDFSLVQRKASRTGRVDPAAAQTPDQSAAQGRAVPAGEEKKLIPLGGRWYYEPDLAAGESPTAAPVPLTITEENAERLFYRTDRLVTPFLGNMTAWLRPGHKDEQGNVVTQDRFVPDNVVVLFRGDGFLTLKTKGIPNHPTAQFPGLNPSYIQARTRTYRLPLEPTLNPQAVPMDDSDRNGALPMGPIGVAINGVVFFNPFDAGMRDASSIMDFCCGHPAPDNQYHYHKYPICVNTPFVDKGDAPSGILGFAFDGLPIYGPYQEAGVMAKDSATNPLNVFNACYDEARGWHYHVTPGKFPYLIGGYFAKVEASNVMQGRGPGGGGPGGQGGPGGFPPPPFGEGGGRPFPPPPD